MSASFLTGSTRVPLPRRSGLSAEESKQLRPILERLRRCWNAGQPLLVEQLLAEHPSWDSRSDLVFQLVCEEICLRREQGESVSISGLASRFPHWRSQLEVLLECQRLFEDEATHFPEVGSTVGEFRLVTELGRGAHSRVFLAHQTPLGDRPVVLKVVPMGTYEHLCLARLQHTYIVPLYSAHPDPEAERVLLCMPYFGQHSLASVLANLRHIPIASRSGRHLLRELDKTDPDLPELPSKSSARKFLSRVSYTSSICWLGVCLAEAVQYAHERELIHLDIKPSNILLTADAQPMLLDFHLAQRPLEVGQVESPWVGGTPPYMSPEQREALLEIARGEPISFPVDGRSDIYSLGATLCEALGAEPPREGRWQIPRQAISTGLADILARCLSDDPRDRYPDPAALAEDLRRHLNHQPLRGVANRSLPERWQKWRARNPHALAQTGLVCAALAVFAFLVVFFLNSLWNRSATTSTTTQTRTQQVIGEKKMSPRPTKPPEAYRMGALLMLEGKTWLAADFFEAAVREDPTHSASHFRAGVCQYQLGRHEEACLAFTACVALTTGKDRAGANFNRGLARYRLEQYERARDDFLEAKRLGASRRDVLYNLALVAHELGQREEVRRYVDRLLALEPEHEQGRRLLEATPP